jgi:hypothetical protein
MENRVKKFMDQEPKGETTLKGLDGKEIPAKILEETPDHKVAEPSRDDVKNVLLPVNGGVCMKNSAGSKVSIGIVPTGPGELGVSVAFLNPDEELPSSMAELSSHGVVFGPDSFHEFMQGLQQAQKSIIKHLDPDGKKAEAVKKIGETLDGLLNEDVDWST